MKKVLVVYLSRTGNTKKMAEFIAEGIRMTGNTVELKKLSQIKSERTYFGNSRRYSRLPRLR